MSLFRHNSNVKLIFSFDYYVGIATSNAYQSFDIMKYKKIRDRLLKEKIVKRKQIIAPEMVSYEDLALVHDSEYIKNIQDPLKVASYLRIGEVDPWDSYILEYFRTVTGGTILAAEYALNKKGIVFNLGGGFHHAHPDHAGGFCLLNDVAVAIAKVRLSQRSLKVLIVDLDYHQGDGNLIIYKNDPDVFTFSMHAAKWLELEKDYNLDLLIQHNISGEQYLGILESRLEPILNSYDPDIVFYIAGSDPYELDTLCDLNLTRDEMLQRNLYVTNLVKNNKIPLVVVAGGGYGSESWKIYYDYICSVLKGKYQ